MPIHPFIERASAPSPEASANEARTRLSIAAEAARARLGATGASIPPPAPVVPCAVEHAVVETTLPERVDEATLPGTVDYVPTAASFDETPGLEPEPEEAHDTPQPVHHASLSARHERPRRRASLSPELVFGTTATKTSKRSAR